MELPVSVRGRVQVEAWVVAAASADLLSSLAVSVAGVDVALAAEVDGPGVVYRGTVAVDRDGPVPVALRVPRTARLGDEDGFGVAVTRLRLTPLDASTPPGG